MGWVLTVEEDAPGAALLRGALAFRGHHVVPATSLAEAITRLGAWLPDLVVTDLRIGGEPLLTYIRGNEALATLPVVVVTTPTMLGERERLLGLGFDGYIAKPVPLVTFAQAVEAFVATGARRGAAAARRVAPIANPTGA
jgi:CheY-like chemotaxis protein